MNWQIFFASVAIFVIIAEILYRLGNKDNIIGYGAVFYTAMFAVDRFIGIFSYDRTLGIILFLYSILIVSVTFEQAGRKLKRWFYLTLLFPFLATVYKLVEK